MTAVGDGLLGLGAWMLRVPGVGRALAAIADGALPVPAIDVEALAARWPADGIGAGAAPDVLVGGAIAASGARDAAIAAAGTDAIASHGPLGGEAVVVKDSIDVAGWPTRLGLRDHDGGDDAARDATIVARVRAAGGRILGKAVMTELGLDGLGALVHAGAPHNPCCAGYAPGGSSTGTAVAIAIGAARYGLGGDGLGSVRIPAAYCGLVGLKPGINRLPTDGYRTPAPSFDMPGPMARTAADCARLWQVMAGEPVVALTPAVPPRLALIRQLGPALASRTVAAGFARALAALGVAPETVDVAGAERATLLGALGAARELAASPYARRAGTAAGRLTAALGGAITPPAARRLARARARLRDALLRALDQVGVIAMPTSAIPPPALTRALVAGAQDMVLLRAIGAYTPLANLAGCAAIAVPCGVDERGRPLSIMFLAAPGEETALCRLALAVEATGLGRVPAGGDDRARDRLAAP